MIVAVASVVLLSLAPPSSTSTTPPGGYWGVGERRESAPPDGHDLIWAGSAVFPLGLIRLGAAFATLAYTSPSRCTLSGSGCQSLQIYGNVGIGFGVAMTASGIGLLSVGLSRRAKHRAWKRARNLAVAPWLGLGSQAGGAGARATFRF